MLFLLFLFLAEPGQTTSPMDGAARLAAYETRTTMAPVSPLRRMPLRSVGPMAMGARVVALQGFRKDPDTYFCAYASGGLWKSGNRGNSWTPLFDASPSISIGDFAVDPDDHNRIWIGTGEDNASRSSYAGTGVFYSGDGGKTWVHQGLADSHHISAVVLHPTRKKTLWVASMGPLYSEGGERGVYKSTDGGAHWRRVLTPDKGVGVIELVMDPSNPDRLFAATWRRSRRAWSFQAAGAGSGVWLSLDGGETWSPSGSGLPTGDQVGRIGLAVSRSNPKVIYATVDHQAPDLAAEPEHAPLSPRRLKTMTRDALLKVSDQDLETFLRTYGFHKDVTAAPLKADLNSGAVTVADLTAYLDDGVSSVFDPGVIGVSVYRSNDGGRTWGRTHTRPIPDLAFSYGYYFGKLAVDPKNPDVVYVLGVPLLKSVDGGKTFANIMRGNVHIDHQAIWIHPDNPRHILLGNDGGVNISFDGGEHWMNHNFQAVGQFYTVAYDMATPYRIYGGMQDNGVWRGPAHARDQYDPPWIKISGGDGAFVQVDPRDNETIYCGSQFGYYERRNTLTGDVLEIQPRHGLKEAPLRFNWMTPLVLSRHHPDRLYLGAQMVFVSRDRGEHFEPMTEDLTTRPKGGNVPYGTITVLRESPQRSDLLYAGTDDGRLWRIEDKQVLEITGSLDQGLWVSGLEVSSHDEGVLFVTLTGFRNDDFRTYVYMSRDDGLSWRSIKSNLPDEACNVIRQDPVNPKVLYLGTDLGLFISYTAGDSWFVWPGLPHVPVYAMEIHPREHELIVGTHGRSIFVADLAPVAAVEAGHLAEALHVYTPIELRVTGERLGRINHWGLEDWRPPTTRFHYITRTGGDLEVTLKRDTRVVFQRREKVGSGLNELVWDYAVEVPEATVANPDQDQIWKRGADGRRYVQPGDYQMVWILRPPSGEAVMREGQFRIR